MKCESFHTSKSYLYQIRIKVTIVITKFSLFVAKHKVDTSVDNYWSSWSSSSTSTLFSLLLAWHEVDTSAAVDGNPGAGRLGKESCRWWGTFYSNNHGMIISHRCHTYPIKITSYLDHEISSWTWAALADGPWTDPSLLVLHLFQPFQTTPFVCHLFSSLQKERRSKCFDISGISSAVTLGFVGVILAFWVRILTYNHSFNFRKFIWNN